MKEITDALLKKASTDRTFYEALKHFAVSNQLYAMASELKNYEEIHFKTPEEKIARDKGEILSTILRMCDLTVTPKMAYFIYEIFREYDQKGTGFDLNTTVTLRSTVDTYFP